MNVVTAFTYEELFQQWQNVAIAALDTGMTGLFNSAEDVLMEFADKAENATIQNHFYEAQREVWLKREDIVQDFRDLLRKSLANWKPVRKNVKPVSPDANVLSLLNKDNYEKSLGLQTITDIAERNHQQVLYALSQRLAVVHQGGFIGIEDVPASPGTISDIYSRCIERLAIETDVFLVLYTLFDKHVMSQVGEIYESLNSRLIDRGILPNLKYQVHIPKQSDYISVADAAPTEEGADVPVVQDASVGDETLVRIRQLMKDQRDQRLQKQRGIETSTAVVATVAAASSVSTPMLVSTINHVDSFEAPLPEEVALHNGNSNMVAINKDLLLRIQTVLQKQRDIVKDKVGQEQLTGDQENIIDLVGLLFERMLNDRFVPEVSKALLGHLHTPFLKIALQDGHFLSNHEHPARRFLDLAIELSGEWIDTQNLDQGIYPTLREAVFLLAKSHKYEGEHFEKQTNLLCERLKVIERKAKSIEKRSLDSEKGKSNLEHAKETALDSIGNIFGQQRITEETRTFVDTVFLDYLTLLSLRTNNEDDDANWQLGQELGQSILLVSKKSINGRITDRDVEIISAHLVKKIGGLIPHHMVHIESFVESLKKSASATLVEFPAPAKIEREGAVDDAPKLCEKLRSLPPETWVDFQQPDGSYRRLRPSWYNPSSDHILFLDSAGKKAALMKVTDFASQVRAGTARVLQKESRSFFNRALSSIYKMLSNAE